MLESPIPCLYSVLTLKTRYKLGKLISLPDKLERKFVVFITGYEGKLIGQYIKNGSQILLQCCHSRNVRYCMVLGLLKAFESTPEHVLFNLSHLLL